MRHRGWLHVSYWVSIGLAMLGLAASGPPAGAQIQSADVLRSSGQHCCSLGPLAAWMGAQVEWQGGGRQARVTCGNRVVCLSAGTPLAIIGTPGDARMLPTCPTRQRGALFVPTRAVVEALGGTVASAPGGLQVSYQGRDVVLPLPPAEPTRRGMDRLIADLHDPRVPLADPELQAAIAQGDQTRQQVDAFNAVAGPLQPSLKAVGDSKTLDLIGHIPKVGTAVSVFKDAAGAMGEAIRASQKLASFDEKASAPIRRGFQAATRVANAPSPITAREVRPAWSKAIPALNEQLALSQKTTGYLERMLTALSLLDSAMQRPGKFSQGAQAPPSLQPTIEASRQFLVFLKAHRWQATAYKEYFSKLLADSARL